MTEDSVNNIDRKAFKGADSGSRCSARYWAFDNFRVRKGLGDDGEFC